MNSELTHIRRFMRENGLNQTCLCDGQLIGFGKAKLYCEYVSIELAVDFERKKVMVTKIREDAVRNNRNRFREVDYKETSWHTIDDALQLIAKFCKAFNNNKAVGGMRDEWGQ